jgi:hypothetical protein
MTADHRSRWVHINLALRSCRPWRTSVFAGTFGWACGHGFANAIGLNHHAPTYIVDVSYSLRIDGLFRQ